MLHVSKIKLNELSRVMISANNSHCITYFYLQKQLEHIVIIMCVVIFSPSLLLRRPRHADPRIQKSKRSSKNKKGAAAPLHSDSECITTLEMIIQA